MQWVKVHTSLLRNIVYRRLSCGAKLTFHTALLMAGDLEADGVLTARTGPITVAEMASETGLTPPRQQIALDELVSAAFLYIGTDSAYGICLWDEKAGDESAAVSHRERQRRYRQNIKERDAKRDGTRDASPVTQKVTDIELDIELEKEGGGKPPRTPAKEIAEADIPRFDDLELDVVAYVANAAAENKTGKISLGRELGIRRELQALLGEIGSRDAFALGLRSANAKGKPNANYLKACASDYGKPARVFPRQKPADPYAAWEKSA